MIKKILIIIFTTYALTINVIASDDGELILKKNDPAEIEDCSENFNRATFKFNQALDGIIFQPIACIKCVFPNPTPPYKNKGLNDTLSASAILCEAAKASSFGFPTTKLSNVNLGSRGAPNSLGYEDC